MSNPQKEPVSYDERDPEILLDGRRHPRGWKSMSYAEKIDFIGTRILAEDRHGVTSHAEIKESGILSVSQYERRKNREVSSQFGSLDTIKPVEGVFNRVWVRDIRGVRNTEVFEEQPVTTSNPTEDEDETDG